VRQKLRSAGINDNPEKQCAGLDWQAWREFNLRQQAIIEISRRSRSR